MAATDKAKRSLESASTCIERMTDLVEDASSENKHVMQAVRELAEVTYRVGCAIVEQLAAPNKQS